MSAITWTSTPTMASIKLPSGNVYYLKDAEVRAWVGNGTSSGAEYRITTLESAVAALSNATHWLGITTTTLTDGATTNPITINGNPVTAVNGDIVQYSNNEFIFNGTAWQEFGAGIGILGNFAYVDQGTATFTPAGSTSSSSVSYSGSHPSDSVLGADTTFSGADSSVTFNTSTTGATVTALTSSVTATVPKLTPTTKYVTASPTTNNLNVTSINNCSFSMDQTDTEMLVIGAASTTVATGSVSAGGTGSSVVTGVGLSSSATTSTGAVTVVESASNSGTESVTFDTSTSGKTATVLTSSITATAAGQTVTAASNDPVTALTGVASGSVQTWSPTQQTIDVNPKTST